MGRNIRMIRVHNVVYSSGLCVGVCVVAIDQMWAKCGLPVASQGHFRKPQVLPRASPFNLPNSHPSPSKKSDFLLMEAYKSSSFHYMGIERILQVPPPNTKVALWDTSYLHWGGLVVAVCCAAIGAGPQAWPQLPELAYSCSRRTGLRCHL